MLDKINSILKEALAAAAEIKTTEQLTEFDQKYLGRKSELIEILRKIKDLPVDERGPVGQEGNKAKVRITEEVARLTKIIAKKDYDLKLKTDKLDVTAAIKSYPTGALHPITKERIKVESIFTSMGFQVFEPMMIDDEYHNFTSLNIPENHPAKDMWDTIWTEDNQYLITHTSSMQNRIISTNEPPIRAIVPGKCFRNEATDRTHEHTFNQIEGVYVDKGIKLSDMFGILQSFLNEYFQIEVPIKIQPTFFPFVEPGIEIMMNYSVFMDMLGIKKSSLADKWIEIIPCGPIHPFVIREAGLDPNIYSGFAWGFGLDRLVMLKYGIDDIRLFHSGELDFIKQFN